MLNWLKKHFIPHSGNDHRPYFLRKENLKNIVIVILFLEIFTFLIPTLTHINRNGGMAAVLPAILATLTNEERQANNLQTLTTNPVLVKAAEMKAQDMATKSYFAHTSPEGKTPWYWLDLVGYKYQYAGENLAINFSDSKDVTNAWMDSPTHRANIVKDKYTEVGTGVATGMYQERETVFVAQVYANPRKVIEIIPQPKKAEATADSNIVKTTPAKNIKDTKILGAETETAPKVSFLDKIFASPRNSTNIILFIILGVILLSLILNIFIKIKHHYPDLILNGLIVIVILGAIFVANYYLSHKGMIVTQNLDYSNEGK